MAETQTEPAAQVNGSANGQARPVFNFDAGQFSRRLRSLPTSQQTIDAQIARFGGTVLARSRYLALNDPYAAAAKDAFVTALVGDGINPSLPGSVDETLKTDIMAAWGEWTDVADVELRADFGGLQQIIAGELFEAGEVFIVPRTNRDLDVPLQFEIWPSEMLPTNKNQIATSDRGRIEMGIEFDRNNRRVAYHFLKSHPGSSLQIRSDQTVRIPADQIIHMYRRIRAGQIRGVPDTLASITKLAILNAYEDAELERKRTAALIAAFVIRPLTDSVAHPFAPSTNEADGETDGFVQSLEESRDAAGLTAPEGSAAFEPGSIVDLAIGEDVRFSTPADVGGSYEAFMYRQLLAVAVGFGVPYTEITGDLRQANFSSMRGGMLPFRRRIKALQNRIMVFQFCAPVWRRWMVDASLAGAVPVLPPQLQDNSRELLRIKWQFPKFPWVDPFKDRQAEKIAVDNGWKARSDVIEEEGGDPEEVDARIKADQERADRLELRLGELAKTNAAVPAKDPDDDDSDEDPDDGRRRNPDNEDPDDDTSS